ncbi:MAG: ATP-binding protein [Clostridiales bacterium]|nr:ATP-binding protein [Clostridiales bacterium]
MLNAVVHKDYTSGIPIQISVYDDKLYIANDGRLPETWTIEEFLGKHRSKPFNPLIAHVFYLAGYIESWGRGIEKIFEACEADGVYKPEYTIHPGDIMVKFYAPEDRVIRTGNNAIRKGDNKGDNKYLHHQAINHNNWSLFFMQTHSNLTACQYIRYNRSITPNYINRKGIS